ncbi:MAG: redox-sensing transcriptional repressor Rex [Lentisphaerae bacterium]|nr:redox-sensing transcriptional repressor Rex [Lentisphaerota bacterium]
MSLQNNIVQIEMIHRLVRYKNALQKFKALGLTRVFSTNLAEMAGISAGLVRKDMSQAGLTVGNRRAGYPLDALAQGLDAILGSHLQQRVIIVGCGRIGTALMHYPGFSSESIQIVAGFDTKPGRLDPHAAIPILPVDRMPDFVKKHEVGIAILSVPEAAAATTFDQLAEAGIQGVVNFTPVQLKAPHPLLVQNINIALEIENLFYCVRFHNRTPN